MSQKASRFFFLIFLRWPYSLLWWTKTCVLAD